MGPPPDRQYGTPPYDRTQEAIAFLAKYDQETKRVPRGRMHDVIRAIRDTGTYEMTIDELTMAAKMAWRNSTRCNGRRIWRGLVVNDYRHLTTAGEIFEACVDHIRKATNRGKLLPMISVFAQKQDRKPGIRIWNPQLIRFAGYAQGDGTVIGDPGNAELTQQAIKLGWKAKGGDFDVLPLIIQMPNEEPRMFEIPEDAVAMVPIVHPDLAWFEELGLKWHGLPAVSEMCLDGGGLTYTAAPFSGWYMDNEIASRNFADTDRYNMLPVIAERMGLDTRHDRTLWKDRVLLELNRAVNHSFRVAGVTMVDHHTVSSQFMRFLDQEEKLGRVPLAEWSWVVPPMSSAACPTFHRTYVCEDVRPNYYYQRPPWQAAK
ncbi:MAG: nitric oxide synthase oxygenase [Myxococcales bacterium]|nr:nitric oxide synthase oxygenase [Myxococcales bacterium]